MKQLTVIAVLSALFLCPNLSAQTDFARFVPDVEGFRFELQGQTDSPSEAVESIPFSAPILQEAGFRWLSTWSVRMGDSVPFRLQVIETGDSMGTYELFNLLPVLIADRDYQNLSLPVGNLVYPSGGVFWKGKFFFALESPSGFLNEPFFTRLVTGLAEAIPMENLLPVTVSHLPGEGLSRDSVRFYLGAESLRMNPLFPDPLLEEIGLTDRIEIAFARYEPGGHGLFVIGYPTVALSRDYLERLQNRLQSFFSKEGIYMKRSGILIGLFVGPEDQAVQVLSQLNYTPSVQWVQEEKPRDHRQETITFLGLVTRAILGTGALILLIIGLGVVAGLIRYGLIRRYPVLLRHDDMIRLNLKNPSRPHRDAQ